MHPSPLPVYVVPLAVPYLRPSPSIFYLKSSLALRLRHTGGGPPQVSLIRSSTGARGSFVTHGLVQHTPGRPDETKSQPHNFTS